MRKNLAQLLEHSPPAISEADNGASAIAACRANRFDLVFLDLTMPGLSGYEVLAVLRVCRLDGKVVVLSADVQPKARERALQLGAAAFLRKPPDLEEIRRFLAAQGLLGEPSP